jgi:uncharacterized protein YndB with AHSA1/START domain
MIDGDRVVHEARYPHSLSDVWDALTEPEALAAWLMPNNFAPIAGHRFQLDSSPSLGIIEGEVLDVDPPSLLRCRWVIEGVPSEVTMRLRADGPGTLLQLEHVRITPQARPGFDSGWSAKFDRDFVLVLTGARDRTRSEVEGGLYRHPDLTVRKESDTQPAGEERAGES